MTDKELRHLSRAELIDIIYELKKQNDRKDAQMKEIQTALDERTICIANAGSIAEAALRLNDVFEAAQAAADQYLASVKAFANVEAEDMEQTSGFTEQTAASAMVGTEP